MHHRPLSLRRLPQLATLLPTLLALAGPWSSTSALAAPTELAPGVVHPAGTELAVSALGLRFTVPTGCEGGLSAEVEGVVLACAGRQGLALATGEAGVTLEGLKAALSVALPLDPELTLLPRGSPQVEGQRLRVDYSIAQAPDHGGLGLAVVGDNGTGVLLLAAGPTGELPAWHASMESLAASLTFSPPTAPSAAAVESPPATAPQGPLAEILRGKRLRFLHSRSGFTDEWSIDLCSDGSFRYRRASSAFSSGFSGDFSAASDEVQGGAWSVQGQELTLRYERGAVEQAPLVQRRDGWYHGETRYFLVDENATCR